MVIKVKEPILERYDNMKFRQLICTYFHFTSSKDLTLSMLKKKITELAYETVQELNGELSLLTPMSKIAGKIVGQVVAQCLSDSNRGNGKLTGGVLGVGPTKIVIISSGTAGTCAAKVHAGVCGYVEVFDINLKRLRYLDDVLQKNVKLPCFSNYNILKSIKDADVLIGAVYISGVKTPKIISKEMIKSLKPKTIIIDVCIDQGECVGTIYPTTHSEPNYIVDNVIHYCVANIPRVSKNFDDSPNRCYIKYGLDIANKRYDKAITEDKTLGKCLNMIDGKITCKPIADTHNMDYFPVGSFI